MWFRNLTVYRFSEGTAKSVEGELEAALSERPVRPCGPLELSTRGFTQPLGEPAGPYTHTCCNAVMFALAGEDKILPASVVKAAVDRKAKEVAEGEGRRVGARERKRIKDEVLTDLLARALVKPYRVSGYVDLQDGWAVIDTASRKAADGAITELRNALGSFPVLPAAPEESPRTLLTHWLAQRELPQAFELGDECELRSPGEGGQIWRGRRADLESEEVAQHLKAGEQAYRVAINFDGRLSCVLGEDLVIRKLRFLDSVLDEIDDGESASDASAEFAARMAILVIELRSFLARLTDIFGLPRPVGR